LDEDANAIHTSTVNVTNDGNIAEKFALDHDYAGTWGYVAADDPSDDEFDIRGLFAEKLDGLAEADFALNDTIPAGVTTADADLFARTADAAGVKGYNVAAAGARLLFIQFRGPKTNGGADAHEITVGVTAQVQ
jgi:hypothetical protein